jgi:NCAIR mutase (PurE)-related protein
MTDKSGIPSGVLKLLRDYKSGSLDETAILARLNATLFEDLEHSTIDHDRARRTGAAEVIFGQGKTPDQLADAFAALTDAGSNVMATRVDDAGAAAILARKPEAEYFSAARIAQLKQNSGPRTTSSIAVVSAGTSDFAVAEEAAVTAEFYDNPVLRISDVGVAGLHRLLARIPEIRSARVIVVIAGMEGALPSVVGGLVDKPIIAVPTSVGYGAAFEGMAALLGMLTSCAAGVSVVNIDNGFGAGFQANMINRL